MRYLGNKTRMIEKIDQFISNLGIQGETFQCFGLFQNQV